MDTPPPSRGGHRRLNSIENDDWTERDGDELQDERYAAGRRSQRRTVKTKQSTGETDNDAMSEAEEYTNDRYNTADERTHLLPPSGISTNEYADSRQHQQRHRAGRSGPSSGFRASDELKATSRINNTTSFALYELEVRFKWLAQCSLSQYFT